MFLHFKTHCNHNMKWNNGNPICMQFAEFSKFLVVFTLVWLGPFALRVCYNWSSVNTVFELRSVQRTDPWAFWKWWSWVCFSGIIVSSISDVKAVRAWFHMPGNVIWFNLLHYFLFQVSWCQGKGQMGSLIDVSKEKFSCNWSTVISFTFVYG